MSTATQRKHTGRLGAVAPTPGGTGPQPPKHLLGPGGQQWQCPCRAGGGACGCGNAMAPEIVAVNTTCDQTGAFQKSALMATAILTAIFGATTIILILALVMKTQKMGKASSGTGLQ